MNKILTLASRELIRYFSTPLAYVFIIIFLSVSGAFTFYIGHFFENGEADLTAFFSYLPWLYLFLIPACSMRLWAEERKTGTIIQLMTLPLSVAQAVLGKFLAALGIIAIALFLTFPLWLTVNYLGNPDNGVIFASYLISLLMAAGYLSIGSCLSAACKSQVIAFILSALVCFLFTMSGLDLVLEFFKGFASKNVVEIIASLSFLDHFNSITEGIIRLNDIVYFASIIAIWLFANVIVVEIKTRQASLFAGDLVKSKLSIVLFALGLILFLGINIISQNLFKPYGFDLTEKKLFTLSPATEEILSSIDESINLKLFYSPKLGEANPNYKIFFERTKNLLEKYQTRSNNRLKVSIIEPTPFSPNEDLAISLGMQGVPIVGSEENAYFGIYASNSVDVRKTIPFFALSREPYIEYDISNMLYNLVYTNKKIVALMGDTNICGSYQDKYQFEPWTILSYLKEFYDVRCVSEEDLSAVNYLKRFDALMLVHPKIMSEKSLYAIDQYLMDGGKAMIFVDPVPQVKVETEPADINSLEPSESYGLLDNLGVSFIKDKVVTDIDAARKIDDSKEKRPNLVDDVTLLNIGQDNFDENSNLFAGIDRIFFSTAGVLRRSNNSSVSFYPLIMSGPRTMLINSDTVRYKVDADALLNHYESDGHGEILAALVNGNIKSLFKTPPSGVDPKEFKSSSKSAVTAAVIADIDMLNDRIWVKRRPFFGTELRQPLANNADFLLNVLDNLTGSISLTSLRGKGTFSRPFTLIENKQKTAQIKYREKMKELANRIAEINANIKEIRNLNVSNPEVLLTEQDKQQLKDKQQELLTLKKELRKINLSLQKDIQKISSILKWINIALIPLLIILGILVLKLKKHKVEHKVFFKINLPNLKNLKIGQGVYSSLSLTVLVLILAYLSSLVNAPSEKESLMGKKIYPELINKVNQISKIEINDSKGKLILKPVGNLWTIDGFDNYPLASAIIRGFLLDLAELEYFEPKTELESRQRFLYLKDFNDSNSKSVNYKIYDTSGKVVVDLLVGDMRKDLALNADGYYLKKTGEEQTWLALGNFFRGTSNKYDWIGGILFDFPLKDIDFMERYKPASNKQPQRFIHEKEGEILLTLENIDKGYTIKDKRLTTSLVKTFSSLLFSEIRKQAIFLNKQAPEEIIKLRLKSGLEILMNVYKIDEDYWVVIKDLSIDKKGAIPEDILKRSLGWMYKLDSNSAKHLMLKKADFVNKN